MAWERVRVIKNTVTGLYFKGNPSGWTGSYLRSDKVRWTSTPQKACRYSMSDNHTAALKFVQETLDNEFEMKMVVEQYHTQWRRCHTA